MGQLCRLGDVGLGAELGVAVGGDGGDGGGDDGEGGDEGGGGDSEGAAAAEHSLRGPDVGGGGGLVAGVAVLGEPPCCVAGGVAAEELTAAVFPVGGLALESGLQGQVVAAVGDGFGQCRPGHQELFVSQTDVVTGSGQQTLVFQTGGHGLLARVELVTGDGPAGGQTLLVDRHEPGQESFQLRPAISGQGSFGGLSARRAMAPSIRPTLS